MMVLKRLEEEMAMTILVKSGKTESPRLCLIQTCQNLLLWTAVPSPLKKAIKAIILQAMVLSAMVVLLPTVLPQDNRVKSAAAQ